MDDNLHKILGQTLPLIAFFKLRVMLLTPPSANKDGSQGAVFINVLCATTE